ncbi:glycogen synthase [Patescibacteria group bacterium]
MPPSKTRKILFVSAEIDPFHKAGGLADVSRALPLQLKKRGHDIRVVMPLHNSVERDFKDQLELVVEKATVRFGNDYINYSIWKGMLEDKIPAYFIDNQGYFAQRKDPYNYVDDNNRYAFFARAVLELPKYIDWYPEVIHSNEWATGGIPLYFQKVYWEDENYKDTVNVFTIHNLFYQGPPDRVVKRDDEIDKGGRIPAFDSPQFQLVNFLKRAINNTDAITAVSEQYAKEILTKEYGGLLVDDLNKQKDRLFGIMNGIEYGKFDPAADTNIYTNYSLETLDKKVENKLALQKEFKLKVDKDVPLLTFVGRWWGQKGFSLINKILPYLLKCDVQVFLVGEGDPRFHRSVINLHKKYKDKLAVYDHFSVEYGQKAYAAGDMFLLPSRYEPAGLVQLFALHYGSIPIVRAVGGLVDSVKNYDPVKETGNGFVFKGFNAFDFYAAIVRALEIYKFKDKWRKLQEYGMKQDLSWKTAAKKYEEVYEFALKNPRRRIKP